MPFEIISNHAALCLSQHPLDALRTGMYLIRLSVHPAVCLYIRVFIGLSIRRNQVDQASDVNVPFGGYDL